MTTSNPPILPTAAGNLDTPVGTTVLTGPQATRAVRKALSHPVASTLVVLITVVWTVPVLGFFINSFRTKEDVYGSGWWTWFAHPGSSTLGNYRQVFSGGGLTLPLVNSLAITIPGTIIPIMLASMAAYAIAWVRFRGSNVLFFSIFALQVVPLQMALVPLQKYYNGGVHLFGVTVIPNFGLKGSLADIWLSHTMFSMPLAVFLLHNFIAALPESLVEAARVDGASHLRIFYSIVLPLSTPAIASFGIFQFLWVWNDLLVAKIFGTSGPSSQPVTASIQSLSGSFGSHLELVAPAGFVAIVIPLIVFLALQRFFVRGLLAGSVKG